MALTRKMLKAMGIEEDKIEQIIEAHGETVNALKEERDDYKTKADTLPDVQKQLDDAKAIIAKHGDGEVVPKSDYEKIKKEFETYKTDQETKAKRAATERAVRDWYLGEVGIAEGRIDMVMKVTSIDDFELDENGKIKDAATKTEAAKTEWADFIEVTQTRGAGAPKPPRNTGGTVLTRDEIFKTENGRYVLNASERQAALAKLLEKGE